MKRTRSLLLLLCAGMALVRVAWSQADTDQIDIGTVEAPTWTVPVELTVRVRVTAMDPPEATPIQWRYGGEGMGGEVVKGTLAKADTADAPLAPAAPAKADDKKSPAPKGPTFEVGEWSAPLSLAALKSPPWPSRLFVTFTVGRTPKFASPTDRRVVSCTKGVTLEFEVAYKGKTVKTYRESSPDGSSVGLVLWPERWAGAASPDYGLGVMGLLEYVTLRAEHMETLPWGKAELPKRFSIVTDLGGYGVGSGYGIHHGNPTIAEVEARTLRQLGVNGLRAAPSFLLDQAKAGQGVGTGFARTRIVQIGGYPAVPKPRVKNDDLAVGCPFSDKVPELTRNAVARALDDMRAAGAPEVWGLTVDEIGVVFDQANDGKAHVEKCPRCRDEFVKMLQAAGRTPADFGRSDWAAVKPFVLNPKDPDLSWQSKDGQALTAYYTRQFIADASASMFTPLRQAVAEANALKAKAAPGTPAASQPAMITYALRGNTFLLGGHSLDFFDFYRRSDNGFVYETSNRDPRIHEWDSYLCDVGRVVSAEQGLTFGVYVKPHRGAVVQRALTAISRGATMLFWYTYGPDYSKGDCFSASLSRLELTSKAAHLIGKAEESLYGARWAQPARIGVVKPNTTEHWLALMQKDPVWSASWENAKWVYCALAHEHLAVDPLDEGMLESRDLSAYRVLYVHGPNLRKAAAAKLAQWVRDGGTLYASGWSLTRDEANQPLAAMLPVLGLESRAAAEMYLDVKCYMAGTLDSFEAADRAHGRLAEVPAGASVKGGTPFDASFAPRVGREVLKPAAGTEVLARFADGAAAVTRHAHGKGQAFVVGLFAGLEYSAAVRNETYDMSTQFEAGLRRWVTAPALALVQPGVEPAVPTVEGILLSNPSNGRRSVALMNWTYRVGGMVVKPGGSAGRRVPVPVVVELTDMPLVVRGAGAVAKVRSAMLGRELPFQQQDNTLRVTVPTLQEADVLLLE